MPKLIILGTIALDDIETHAGKARNTLGGSATYAAYAASFFTKPGIVSIIGKDFPEEHYNTLKDKGICTKGVVKEGKTFRWKGSYTKNINEAETLKTELNCLKRLNPKLEDSYKEAEYVFLANVDPEIQLKVLNQIKAPKLIILDTMNLWIKIKKQTLLKVIKKADILLLNDGEAKLLFRTKNLIRAAKQALKLGPKYVIIKKGEHGALLITKNSYFSAPAYPVEDVIDPTGAGDSFGGAFAGYLTLKGERDDKTIKKAIIYGTAVASYNTESFSLLRLKELSSMGINERFLFLKDITLF